MTCKQIKEFVDKEIGFDIAKNSGAFSKNRTSEKAYSRYAYFYLCVKYSTDYISHENIGKEVLMKRLSVRHGLQSFEHLMKYDKLENQNFTILENRFIKHFKPMKRKGMIDFDNDVSKLMQSNWKQKFTAKQRRVKIAALKTRVNQLKKSNIKYRQLLKDC